MLTISFVLSRLIHLLKDANLVLGRLVPSTFPCIFGPNADAPLDLEASLNKFKDITTMINFQRPRSSKPYTIDEVAAGFLRVANENMSRPMRSLTEQKGYPTSAHNLCCFGGAGGQVSFHFTMHNEGHLHFPACLFNRPRTWDRPCYRPKIVERS